MMSSVRLVVILREGRADDDRDREIEHVALGDKVPEFPQHELLPFGVVPKPSGVRRNESFGQLCCELKTALKRRARTLRYAPT